MEPRDNIRDRRQGRWIPWLIVAFFGVVIAANGVMVYIATTTFTGLQTEGHYLKGLAYNRVIEAERAEQALGWQVTVRFESTGERRGRIVAHAEDAAGAPLADAVVVAHLVRPTQDGYDMSITLTSEDNGLYAAEIELPLPGLWEIQTQIVHPSGTYRTAQRRVTP